MPATTKSLYVAEAKVLMAYYYNMLWKLWGNIPYWEELLEAPYIAPQLGHDEVYAKFIALLEDAIAMNVLPMKATVGDEGRVTKAMAYMLYTEAVLYQNDQTRYQTALPRRQARPERLRRQQPDQLQRFRRLPFHEGYHRRAFRPVLL